MAPIYSVHDTQAAALLEGSCCAFGVFDGVHLGHRYVIGETVQAARAQGAKAVALTFDIDPDEMFHAHRLKKLMGNEERLSALARLGLDAVIVFPFTEEFAAQEPRTFLDGAFVAGMPRAMHVGKDFRFGAKAAGDLSALEQWGTALGVDVCGYDLYHFEGAPITSTRIRLLLAEGKISQANALLGSPYAICGEVQAGRGEGGDFGFKTANLHVPDMLKALGDGVYAAYATVDGLRYKAAVSNGVAPTFADKARANVEVHILDFDGDLYGKSIKVEFVEWLRPMRTFPSIDELIATVMGNIQWVRENL